MLFFRVWNLKKIKSKIWTCKKQGAKDRIIVIQKEKRPGCLIFSGSHIDRCFQNKNSRCRLTGQLPGSKWPRSFDGFSKTPHSSLASMLSAHILNLIQVSKFLFHSDSATATSLKADDFRRQSWFNGAGPVDLEGRGDNYPSRFCSIGPKVEVLHL